MFAGAVRPYVLFRYILRFVYFIVLNYPYGPSHLGAILIVN